MDQRSKAANPFLSFMADLHHEIRAPLNTILNMAELALKDDPSTSIKSYLETIEKAASGLLTLLDDIIDLSSQENLACQKNDSIFDLTSVLEDVKETVDGPKDIKGVRIVLNIHEDIPEQLRGSRARIRQILTQLLNFVMRQLDSKHIKLHLSPKEGSKGIQWISFRLEAHYKPGSIMAEIGSDHRLFICKSLLASCGGNLNIEKKQDNWCFDFLIDAQAVNRKGEGFFGEAASTEKVIAVMVNTDEFSSPIISRRIQKEGIIVHGVDSLTKASHLLRSYSEAGNYTICLINWEDVNDMTTLGIPALRNESGLRKLPVVIIEVPAVQMMSLISNEELKEKMGSGPIGFVMKPSKGPQVLMEIAMALGWDAERIFNQKQKMAEMKDAIPDLFKGLKVLVIEDDRINQKLIVEILKKKEIRPVVASSGVVALRAATVRDFDAILMDINLPDTDGYELTQQIRTLKRHTTTPIIALTASTKNRTMCLEAGMDDFLSKPYSKEKLFSVLARWISSSSHP